MLTKEYIFVQDIHDFMELIPFKVKLNINTAIIELERLNILK